jgi:hypothetical protein
LKTVFVKLSGEPKIGDRVSINTTHRVRGGRSTLQYLVEKPREEIIYLDEITVEDPETGELRKEPDFMGRREIKLHFDTTETIVDGLVNSANSNMGPFHGIGAEVKKRSNCEIVIQCNDTLNENEFYGGVENLRGPGVKLELETLG